ncbi:hypothetical protein C475_20777 [Halosimplex carlsbadense 2-9-1]|uniref:Blue (type 1) copper domain-containing protein n=1 Tax=Halosimplex carlsbadense 2-9-1 TaxID=797114 RepID=M0CD04_9EURY|nr:hypothetical protein [Halosimplex carlsbadense]ELZ20247.1 hypothetical protein C475_20777 [Halosimplex carlsbadense 2-9-1]
MTPDNRGSSRRGVLKALGAGTVLAGLGGTAVVGGRDGRAVGGEDVGAVSGADRVQQAESVHTVETLTTGPPTNPDRPADFYYQPTGLAVEPGDMIRFEFVTPDHNVVSYHPAFGMRRRVPLDVAPVSSPLLGYRPDSIPGEMVDPPGEGGEEPTGAATGTPTATVSPGANAGETGTETGTPTDEGEGPEPDHWLLALAEPGVYDFLCSPHEVYGMAMRVVVGDETDAAFETADPEALPEPRVGPAGLARVTLTDPALAPETVVDEGTVEWSALAVNQGDGGTATETPGTETGTAGTETGTPGGATETGTETGG